jgi:hypothetical protein
MLYARCFIGRVAHASKSSQGVPTPVQCTTISRSVEGRLGTVPTLYQRDSSDLSVGRSTAPWVLAVLFVGSWNSSRRSSAIPNSAKTQRRESRMNHAISPCGLSADLGPSTVSHLRSSCAAVSESPIRTVPTSERPSSPARPCGWDWAHGTHFA